MKKIILKIDGMMCPMCESHINDAVRNAVKVKKVTSSHTKGETVILCEQSVDEEKIRQVLEKTGYRLTGMTEEPYEKKGLFGFLK